MKLPDAQWREWPGMDGLLAALDADGGNIRFVGGAVRDTLLGLEVKDVDCATTFPPEEVLSRLEAADVKAVPTGIKHGTITAVIEQSRPIEVTTLRRDVSTDGRHAEVEYTDDWQEDAARRDFTINALSADPLTSEIFDYFGGEEDLQNRLVRFIGDPLKRIAEDHLRILRFFRFHARFGEGEPDADGLAACTARSNDLMALSRERIADELLKTLALPDPSATIKLMIEKGIFAPILPEITMDGWQVLHRLIEREQRLFSSVRPELVEGRESEDQQPPKTDLLQAKDERRAGSGHSDRINPEAIRRFAALLPEDAETATSVATRLKLSKAQRQRLADAAVRSPEDAARPREATYRHGPEHAADKWLLSDADDAAIAEALQSQITNPPPHFPMKGGELIEMGVEAGPEVARVLREIEEAWIAEDFPDDARVMEIARRELEKLK